ncbi:MAG: hypothetical protein RSF86_10425 [Angelakisella sp.]
MGDDTMIVSFCGHGSVAESEKVRQWVLAVTSDLIANGASIFYLGGYGAFDGIAKSVIRKFGKEHPHIKSVLILPYLNKSMDEIGYSYTLYPPLETVPKRFAISKRNEWMVDQSHIVVAYVTHSFGGAAKTLEYAKRKHKHIILYPQYLLGNL